MRPRRFELLTYSFGGCRSIQLSYGRIFVINMLRDFTSPQSPLRTKMAVSSPPRKGSGSARWEATSTWAKYIREDQSGGASRPEVTMFGSDVTASTEGSDL